MTTEPSTPDRRKPRPSPASRRFGYAVTIVVHVVLMYLIYVRPGWRAVPFLTEDAASVVALFVFSLLVGIAVHLVWLVTDPRWLRSLGELVTTAVGLAVAIRFLTVFPFTFADGSSLETLARVILVLAIIGSVIGVVAHAVMVVVNLVRGEPAIDATSESAAG